MTNLEKISRVWDALYDKQNDVRQVIQASFHADYKQSINGVELNRSEYIEHVLEQRRNLDSVTFRYNKHSSEDNKLFAAYHVSAKNLNGESLEAEVIADFEFLDDMLYRINGKVSILHGDPADVDMGSD